MCIKVVFVLLSILFTVSIYQNDELDADYRVPQIVTGDLGFADSSDTRKREQAKVLGSSFVAPGYDEYDYLKIQTFLNQPSAEAGKTNGQAIDSGYDPDNPETWKGIVWSSSQPYRVEYIGYPLGWTKRSLAGAMDLSGLSQLRGIMIQGNNISSLNLSEAGQLQQAYCSGNALTSITLSNNISLKDLDVSISNLSSIDLSEAPKLKILSCGENKLTAIDVTSNTELIELHCSDNQLEVLDVSNNSQLTLISCFNNLLEEVDVSFNPLLDTIIIDNNWITSIDVSSNLLLRELSCSGNLISTLNLHSNLMLALFNCASNNISELDLSDNSDLVALNCSNNRLTSLDLSANPNVASVVCSYNQLEVLDLSEQLSIMDVICTGNPIKEIKTRYIYNHQSISAVGEGYVEYELVHSENIYRVIAIPFDGESLTCWSESGSIFSRKVSIDLERRRNYSLTANFGVVLTSSVSDGKINPGKSVTLTPNILGGTWDWNEDYLDATVGDSATFTARKTGKVTVGYTVEGIRVEYVVSIVQTSNSTHEITPTPESTENPDVTTTSTSGTTGGSVGDSTSDPAGDPTSGTSDTSESGSEDSDKSAGISSRTPMVIAAVLIGAAAIAGGTFLILRILKKRKIEKKTDT